MPLAATATRTASSPRAHHGPSYPWASSHTPPALLALSAPHVPGSRMLRDELPPGEAFLTPLPRRGRVCATPTCSRELCTHLGGPAYLRALSSPTARSRVCPSKAGSSSTLHARAWHARACTLSPGCGSTWEEEPSSASRWGTPLIGGLGSDMQPPPWGAAPRRGRQQRVLRRDLATPGTASRVQPGPGPQGPHQGTRGCARKHSRPRHSHGFAGHCPDTGN